MDLLAPSVVLFNAKRTDKLITLNPVTVDKLDDYN